MTLEAARKQKIHNLKLKTACLENEEYVQELHVSDWSENQKQKLSSAHEKGCQLLSSVESGTKWNLTAAYDIQKLMRVCGLEMSVRELYKPEDKPQFMDILSLKRVLQDMKQHRNKTRIVSFTGTIDNGLSKLEKVEEELRRSQLDATELAQVPVSVLKNLEDCMNVTVIQVCVVSCCIVLCFVFFFCSFTLSHHTFGFAQTALLGNEEQIRQQLASIEKCKEIRNVALADGEMSIAEEQFYIKAQLLERLVELVRDKFRIIGQTDDENKMFSKVCLLPCVQHVTHTHDRSTRCRRRRSKRRLR